MLGDDNTFQNWDSLKMVLGEIVYGGRVIDEADRRVLKVVLNQFISQSSLQKREGSIESESDGCLYRLSHEATSMEDISFRIESLPDKDLPEIFGMSDIADIEFKQQ